MSPSLRRSPVRQRGPRRLLHADTTVGRDFVAGHDVRVGRGVLADSLADSLAGRHASVDDRT